MCVVVHSRYSKAKTENHLKVVFDTRRKELRRWLRRGGGDTFVKGVEKEEKGDGIK